MCLCDEMMELTAAVAVCNYRLTTVMKSTQTTLEVVMVLLKYKHKENIKKKSFNDMDNKKYDGEDVESEK